jgi:hypothetical protein
MTNKHKKVWKVVFRKSLFGKQMQPKSFECFTTNIYRRKFLIFIFHVDENNTKKDNKHTKKR